MRIDIMTLFPDSAASVLGESIIGRAAKKGVIEINCVQIRDFTDNKQRQVDDYPYGGGWGCVMMAQPLHDCLESIKKDAGERRRRVIYMSPQGKRYTQRDAKRLADGYDHLVLVCGHYEGVDERFIELCVDEEISIGDYVLTGGEIPAMAVADSVCRLIPGVLAHEECFTGESHWDGLLEYPQYTRPETWRGLTVPEVLRGGDHALAERWRRKQSIIRTMDKRPDMYAEARLTDRHDVQLVNEIVGERTEKPPDFDFDCRRALPGDIPGVMRVVADARGYLGGQGIDQWQDDYPSAEAFLTDIDRGELWVFLHERSVCGIITASAAPEPGYLEIKAGQWLCETENYLVVHRAAVSAAFRGTALAREMMDFAYDLCIGMGKDSLRADTHRNNAPMRGLLKKCGFTLCGEVQTPVPRGRDPRRLGYEKPV